MANLPSIGGDWFICCVLVYCIDILKKGRTPSAYIFRFHVKGQAQWIILPWPHFVAHLTVQKIPVTTMLTYPWKCTILHCNHLGNTWKPLVLMTRHFDYCPSASEGDNQSVRSSAPVVSRCFPGGYNVKLYISRGKLAWWLLAFLHSVCLWQFMGRCPEGEIPSVHVWCVSKVLQSLI